MEESVCIEESLSYYKKVLRLTRQRRDSTGLSNSLINFQYLRMIEEINV